MLPSSDALMAPAAFYAAASAIASAATARVLALAVKRWLATTHIAQSPSIKIRITS
jgi:hypothetical protein